MPDSARGIIGRYREIWSEVRPGAVPPKMGLVRLIVVGDSDAAAMTAARRAYLRWRTSFCYLFELHGTVPDSPLHAESFDHLIGQGQAIAGSPDTVRAFLANQIETASNYIVGQFCFGDLTIDEMQRSVGLFAEQVMPRLRKDFDR